MDISKSDVSLIGRFGRTIAQTQDVRPVVVEALKIVRQLASASELCIVYSRIMAFPVRGR